MDAYRGIDSVLSWGDLDGFPNKGDLISRGPGVWNIHPVSGGEGVLGLLLEKESFDKYNLQKCF